MGVPARGTPYCLDIPTFRGLLLDYRRSISRNMFRISKLPRARKTLNMNQPYTDPFKLPTKVYGRAQSESGSVGATSAMPRRREEGFHSGSGFRV